MASHQQVAALADRVAYVRGALDLRPSYAPLDPFTRWALGLVAACGALAAVGLGVDLSQLRLLFQPATGGQALQLARAAQEATGGVLRGVRIALFVAMAGGFLTWLYHLRANVRALGVRRPRFSRVWTIAAFLVPGLNCVRPYAVVAEIWRASSPESLDPFEWQELRVPSLLHAWWGAVLAWASLALMALVAEWSAGVVLGRLRFAASLSALADLAACASAVLTCALVARLVEIQRAKWEKMSAPVDGDSAPAADLAGADSCPAARATVAASPPYSAADTSVRMSTRFDADTAVHALAAGRFGARIDPGWWVVAGPNGGYVAAILLRALAASVGDPARTPRSLTVHYAARPAEGAVEIATRIERSGRSLTTLSARMEQDGRLVALALAAFAGPQQREAAGFAHAGMPAAPPPEQCPLLPARIPLHSRYEHRWAIGSQPFAGGAEAVCGGWIRLAEPRALDAPLAAAFCDAFPPAVFSTLAADDALPGGIPTIDLTVHFRSPLPLVAAEPGAYVLAVFRTRLVNQGFLEEDGELWSRDGQLLAHSRQLGLLR